MLTDLRDAIQKSKTLKAPLTILEPKQDHTQMQEKLGNSLYTKKHQPESGSISITKEKKKKDGDQDEQLQNQQQEVKPY